MAAISKFLFEHEFGGAEPTVGAPPRPDTKRYTAAEVEAAKAAAFESGVATGRSAAEREIGQRVGEVLNVIAERLGKLMEESARLHAQRMRDSIATIGEVARKLMPALAKREALSEIQTLVGECLSRLHDEPRLVVRVNDGILDALKQRIEPLAASAGFAGRLILLAENSLRETDARIEWADGGADRDVAAVWQDIESVIQRYVKEGPGASDAAPV